MDFEEYKGQGKAIPDIVSEAAAEYDVPHNIFHALVKQESDYNPYAKNPKSSASGLGQIITGTAKSLGMNVTRGPDDERWNPIQNARMSAKYLRDLYNETGSWDTALARYGEGPRYAQNIMRKAEKIGATVPPKLEFEDYKPAAQMEFEDYKPATAAAVEKPVGAPKPTPEEITPEMVMRGAPEAGYIEPIGTAFGKVMEAPFIPLRKGLEKVYEYLIEPGKAPSLKQWSEALETAPEMVAGAPEAFAPIGSKEAFVSPLEFALAPSYLRFIGKAGQILKAAGVENFYKYAPQWAFKPFAKGGMPVPLSSSEVADKLYAMSGAERAEMARRYPQFRDVLDEMTTLASKEREPYYPEMAARMKETRTGLPYPEGMGETFEMREPASEVKRRPFTYPEIYEGETKIAGKEIPTALERRGIFPEPPPETPPTSTITPTEIVPPRASGDVVPEVQAERGELEFPQVSKPDTSISEGRKDSITSNTEFFADLLKSESFREQGLGGLDIPRQRLVMERVFTALHQPEIRESVIKTIPVDVVNNVIMAKSPADVLLHDKSVLRDQSTIDHANTVSLRSDTADSLVRSVAEATTKRPDFEVPQLAGFPIEGLSTADAVSQHVKNILEKGASVKTDLTEKSLLSDEAGSIPNPGDVLGKGVVAILEDTANLLRNAKPATQRTYGWMKDQSTRLWEWYKSPIAINVPHDYKRIVYDYLGNEQIAGHKNKEFIKNMKLTVPNTITREALTNWIEAGGEETVLREWASKSTNPKLKRGYEAALKLTGEEKAIGAQIGQMYNQWFQEAKAAGILESSLDNYVNHLYEQGIVDKSELKKFKSEINAGMFNTNFNYAKKRIFGSYFDAEQAGKIPKNKDIAFLLGHYYQSMHRAINARKAIKMLHEGTASDGRPLVEIVGGVREIGNEVEGKPFPDVPPEYDMTGNKGPDAYLIYPKIRPDEAKDYRPLDHPALRGWKWVGKDPNGAPMLMQGDMYIHPEAARHLKNVLSKSMVRDWMVGRGALKVSQNLKGVLLSGIPTGFHQTHVGSHAIFHKVNPFTAPPLDFNNPIQQRLVRNGLMVYNHDALAQFAEGLHSTGLAARVPGVGRITQMYGEYLFQDLIPRLKMKMGVDAYERNLEKYKGKYTEDEIAEITANQSNAAFGELNYKAMGRNPTMQDMFRLTALAPDFLEARMRFAGQALRPGGSEQRWALFRAVLGMYAAGVVGNMLFSDGHKPHWDKPFTVVIGKTAYSLRSVPGDMMHLIKDPRSFIYHRLNPATTKALAEFITGRDVYGRLRNVGEQIGDYFKGAVPIPLQFKVSDGEKTLMQAFLQTVGVTSYKNRTELDQKIMDYYMQEAKLNLPPEQRELNKRRRELVQKYEAGDKGGFEKALKEMTRKGGLPLTARQVENIRIRAANKQSFLIKGMEHGAAIDAWKSASPEEKINLVQVMDQKLNNLENKDPAKAKKLAPQIREMRQEMRQIYRMKRAQKAVQAKTMDVDAAVQYIEQGATKQ